MEIRTLLCFGTKAWDIISGLQDLKKSGFGVFLNAKKSFTRVFKQWNICSSSGRTPKACISWVNSGQWKKYFLKLKWYSGTKASWFLFLKKKFHESLQTVEHLKIYWAHVWSLQGGHWTVVSERNKIKKRFGVLVPWC